MSAGNGGGDPRAIGSALVTGGSRGIGAAVARALVADGWRVGIVYRSRAEAAQRLVSEVELGGGAVCAISADVADASAAEEVFAALEDRFGGPVLALVNNAGVTADGLAPRMEDESWQTVIETNLSGAFRMTRRALVPMMRARWGRIVNVGSIVGRRANPGQANYAASKAGLEAMTRTIAAEVARRGITVNAIAPGLITTELTDAGVGNRLVEEIPARRAGTPEEVAACVRFLASDEASYVTGSTLTVDGGLTA